MIFLSAAKVTSIFQENLFQEIPFSSYENSSVRRELILPKTYKNAASLKSHHLLYHTGKPLRYKCELCDFKSNAPTRIEMHVNAVHTDKSHKDTVCPICGKELQNASVLGHISSLHPERFKEMFPNRKPPTNIKKIAPHIA